jgi:hypothetical protein
MNNYKVQKINVQHDTESQDYKDIKATIRILKMLFDYDRSMTVEQALTHNESYVRYCDAKNKPNPMADYERAMGVIK